jgi:hypothetical protein
MNRSRGVFGGVPTVGRAEARRFRAGKDGKPHSKGDVPDPVTYRWKGVMLLGSDDKKKGAT